MVYNTSVYFLCALYAFLTGGNAEGTKSLKMLCLTFVCFVLCKFVSGLIL